MRAANSDHIVASAVARASISPRVSSRPGGRSSRWRGPASGRTGGAFLRRSAAVRSAIRRFVEIWWRLLRSGLPAAAKRPVDLDKLRQFTPRACTRPNSAAKRRVSLSRSKQRQTPSRAFPLAIESPGREICLQRSLQITGPRSSPTRDLKTQLEIVAAQKALKDAQAESQTQKLKEAATAGPATDPTKPK